jgi:hypothetical protein
MSSINTAPCLPRSSGSLRCNVTKRADLIRTVPAVEDRRPKHLTEAGEKRFISLGICAGAVVACSVPLVFAAVFVGMEPVCRSVARASNS